MPRKNTRRNRPQTRHHNRVGKYWNCIGPKIKELRLKAVPKITQEDLAGRLAAQGILINRTAIAKIESRKRTLSDFEIIAIAKALKTPIEQLMKI